jgi:hypothetical protein
MKPKIGKELHSLPNPRPIKQRRFACCGVLSFRPESRGLKPARNIDKKPQIQFYGYFLPHPRTQV